MAGQSKKKSGVKVESSKFSLKIAILLATLVYIALKCYSVFIKGDPFSRADVIGFLVLSLLNFTLYKLILVFFESYFYAYLMDLLILNLLVEVTIFFHWKFWFIYLMIPGYFMFIGSLKLFDYVKTIGKADENEVIPEPTSKKSSKDREKKIIQNK
jgi:hypothetical protein